MTLLKTLFGWLLHPPAAPAGPFGVFIWWESRRLSFNVAIWLAGVFAVPAYDRFVEAYSPGMEAGMEGQVAVFFAVDLFIFTNLIYLLVGLAIAGACIRNRALAACAPRILLTLVFAIWVALPALECAHWYATLNDNRAHST